MANISTHHSRINWTLGLFILIELLFSSCHSPEMPCVVPGASTDTLEFVWSKLLCTDNPQKISRRNFIPYIYQNTVLSSAVAYFSKEKEVISCFDKKTGMLIWKWNDLIHNGNGVDISTAYTRTFVRDENRMLIPTVLGNYVIDLHNGSTLDKILFPENNNLTSDLNWGFTALGNIMFQTSAVGDRDEQNEAYIVKSDLDDLNLKAILTIPAKNGYSPYLLNPAIYIKANGDTLLFCTNTKSKSNQYGVDVFCFNYSKNAMEWFKNDIVFGKPLNIYNAVEENRGYFIAGEIIYCIDLVSGKSVWEKTFKEGITTRMLIKDGKIYVNGGTGDLYCLDSKSGTEIYYKPSSETKIYSGDAMTIFEDRIYLCDNRINILEAATGKLLHRYTSPNDPIAYRESYIEAVTIDPETRLMYFADGYFLNCVKLPK